MNIFFKRWKLDSLKSINNSQKLKLTGIFMLSLSFVWFFFIYSATSNKIAYNLNLLQQINEKKATIEKSEHKCIKLQNKITNLRSDMCCLNTKDIKKEIINYAKDTGISLKSYTLLGENAKTQHNLPKEKISYEFTGQINQIIAFCQKINFSKSCLRCEEIHITRKNESECNIKCILTLLKKAQ